MDYKWFVFILIAGASVSVGLLIRKILVRNTYSWFAVPCPLLLGIAAVSFKFIYWSLVFHSLDGRW